MTNASQRAESLAALGRVGEATALLDRAGAAGDAEALFTAAIWLLSGQYLPRDLAGSRLRFGQAALLGHATAARIQIAFIANGTGGPADWQKACSLLQDLAPSDPVSYRQLTIIRQMALTSDGGPGDLPTSRVLSANPRIAMMPALFSAAECAYLIEAAQPLLEPSVVIDPRSGAFIRDPVRNSSAAAFPLALENPAIHALNRRIAAATSTDVAQGEPLQILSYAPGQEYKLHIDALPPSIDNQRVLTALVYLNDDFDGGETDFPALGLSVRGKTGDALIFANVTSDGHADQQARHAGKSVHAGTKLIASRWIRAKPLDLSGPRHR
jgi:prolyl 4-hydroxylase